MHDFGKFISFPLYVFINDLNWVNWQIYVKIFSQIQIAYEQSK